ncbi:MAG: DUF493 domain-containing protein [Cytophagales bacterium]|nr:DUF493 domain-containing protein [Cytophagales bacterium]
MDTHKAFKEKLDIEHDWPTTYMFKFVVPKNKTKEVRDMFSKETLMEKKSKAGNYVAFTFKKLINSSDEVVDIYLQAKKVKGLISL